MAFFEYAVYERVTQMAGALAEKDRIGVYPAMTRRNFVDGGTFRVHLLLVLRRWHRLMKFKAALGFKFLKGKFINTSNDFYV